jgi:putative CocE/NonD family hydrolase
MNKVPAEAEVEFRWGLKIPMRDGAVLNATLYRPRDTPEPLPVIFRLTPYVSDSYHDRAAYFARHGYAFALVDCRGRGNSEGRFVPHLNEGRDGYDVTEWLAGQPWSDGRVAMYGGSYEGYVQWATAKESPPHLATITPAASGCPGVDWPFHNNILHGYIMQWLTLTSGVTANGNLAGDPSIWMSIYRRMLREHLPLKSLEELSGNPSTEFRNITDHHTPDGYWEQMLPSSEQYGRIGIPVLTITGHYDVNQRGAMHFYRRHIESAAGSARHYLVVGPWDHKGTGKPSRKVAGVEFGEESLLDLNGLHREWYDWTLKGAARPEFLQKPVAYYVAASDEWRYADDLNAISAGRRTFHLTSSDARADINSPGALSEAGPEDSGPDAYTYDPLDTRAAELELEQVEDYLTDDRQVQSSEGGALVYQTEPLAEGLVIAGHLKFNASLALDVPDTDFRVAIYEVTAEGVSIQLTDDMLRARYRRSLKEAEPLTPGEVNVYEFETFRFFARRVARGSRLRLVLSPVNSVYWERNYNGGGVVAEESGRDARVARVTLHHDTRRQSFLEVPLAG